MIEYTDPYFLKHLTEKEIQELNLLNYDDDDALDEFLRHTIHKIKKKGTSSGDSKQGLKDYLKRKRIELRAKRKTNRVKRASKKA